MSCSKKVVLGMLAFTTLTCIALSGDAIGLVVLLVSPPAVLLALAAVAWSAKDTVRLVLAGTLLAAVGVWLRYVTLLLATLGCDDDSSCSAAKAATASTWGIVLLAVLALISSLAIGLMIRSLRHLNHPQPPQQRGSP